MKRIKSLILVFVCMIFLSGCAIKGNYEMTIDKDGQIKIEQISAYDKELIENLLKLENMDETSSEDTNKKFNDEDYMNFFNENMKEEKEEMIKSGYVVDKYHVDDFFGFKASLVIDSIETVSTTENVTYDFESEENLKTSKLFKKSGNKYIANFKLNLSLDEELEETESSDEYAEYIKQINIESKFILKLPQKSISNNAKSVSDDGLTLTWDLTDKNLETINFEFELPSEKEGFKLAYLIYIGLGLLAVAIVVFIIVISKTKSQKRQEELPLTTDDVKWMNAVDNQNLDEESNSDAEVKDEVTSEVAEDIKPVEEVTCPYCDSKISAGLDKCPCCNAKLR